MKVLGLLAAVLFVSTASADFIRYGSVTFQGNSAWIPANKTCINAEGFIVSKSGYVSKTVCRGNSDRGDCTTVKEAVVPQPVMSTFVRYEGGHNGRSDSLTNPVEYTVDQSVQPIYRETHRENGSSSTVIGYYAIPACGSTPPVPAN